MAPRVLSPIRIPVSSATAPISLKSMLVSPQRQRWCHECGSLYATTKVRWAGPRYGTKVLLLVRTPAAILAGARARQGGLVYHGGRGEPPCAIALYGRTSRSLPRSPPPSSSGGARG